MEYLSGVISGVISLCALIISWLAFRKASQAFDYTRTTTSARNTPALTFEVKTTRSDGVRPVALIEVLIHDGGQYPTEIVEGQVRLKSHKYPEAEKPHKLNGLKIFAGTPRLIKIEVKQAVIYRERPEVPATELVCEAVYTRLDQENGEARECYVFNEQQGMFVQK
jgi:sirohydrochlorin ferrochelatase